MIGGVSIVHLQRSSGPSPVRHNAFGQLSAWVIVVGCFLYGHTTCAAPGNATTRLSPQVQIPASGQSERLYPEAVSNLLDDGEKLFTILGVIAAGFWVYVNFLRGRTYRPRLELKVSGALSREGEYTSLIAVISLKNVGLAKVQLLKRGTAFTVNYSPMPTSLPEPAAIKEWRQIDISDLFASHQWIESGEVIDEHRLVVLPKGDYLAFCLDARVVSPRLIGHNKEWNGMTIIAAASGANKKMDI